MNLEEALSLVRRCILLYIPKEQAYELVPENIRDHVQSIIEDEETIILTPAGEILEDPDREEWLRRADRQEWYFWPKLRSFYLENKQWELPSIRSLDRITDKILGQLGDPTANSFDRCGLVLGYVQSGKTSNYTALIAKAVDSGYRLVIVLAGIDNGLRRQTQIRLNQEIVGYSDNRNNAVRYPPAGLQWHSFTTEDIDGDFRRGNASTAALQEGSQPVLLVVKKNGHVLRRIIQWFEEAPIENLNTIPCLIVDDEADLASIDTRGTYQTENEPEYEDTEPPSVINGLIRRILGLFQKKAYVAYTATPYANILIPHDGFNPYFHYDLYPKDFIIDLPKPNGYFGAEELFGDFNSSNDDSGLDVIRFIEEYEISELESLELTESLKRAIFDFVLAGAARIVREGSNIPLTMLIHTSRLISEQNELKELIEDYFQELRDSWRYNRRIRSNLEEQFREIWNTDFIITIKDYDDSLDLEFNEIIAALSEMLNSVVVKTINSESGEVLDYDLEPDLKVIAVGGNRLSRGLTLEGLLTSYFVRNTWNYDTLMQMGRWFGYRNNYVFLTRIYTSRALAGYFQDLANVEHNLREDLKIYEDRGVKPIDVGLRILKHPSMQVTGPLKRRFSREVTLSQSYVNQIVQTFKFPFSRTDELIQICDDNISAVADFIQSLGPANYPNSKGPAWKSEDIGLIIDFLQNFRVSNDTTNLSLPLICRYIEQCNTVGELINWTIAVMGLMEEDAQLGKTDWGAGDINQISRTRLKSNPDSLGVISDPEDEAMGLNSEEIANMERLRDRGTSKRQSARAVRKPQDGLLMLYPISRYSGHHQRGNKRMPLYEDPSQSGVRDLIGIAISFPDSNIPQEVVSYLEGTRGWLPED